VSDPTARDALRRSRANRARYAPALLWSRALAVPHSLAWLDGGKAVPPAPPAALPPDARYPNPEPLDLTAAKVALRELFGAEGFPADVRDGELHWRRDGMGKPYVTWEGAVAGWAASRGKDRRCLHVSNTHDGAAHLVLAAYDEALVGVGIDVVHLPRLRLPGKDSDYLRRFAAKFLSGEEREGFEAAAVEDDEEALRTRIAAHFSLMEAASKACGTGLQIGAGLGGPTSLPKQSLGVRALAPSVELLFGPTAQARLETLGATYREGHWGADGEYLVSAVLLWR